MCARATRPLRVAGAPGATRFSHPSMCSKHVLGKPTSSNEDTHGSRRRSTARPSASQHATTDTTPSVCVVGLRRTSAPSGRAWRLAVVLLCVTRIWDRRQRGAVVVKGKGTSGLLPTLRLGAEARPSQACTGTGRGEERTLGGATRSRLERLSRPLRTWRHSPAMTGIVFVVESRLFCS